MPPEPPPEGVLIESARREARLSVREAARRAGISEGWWRQVARGYQSLSGGTAGLVRDVPAETIAKMARAAGVAPEQMEAEGRRPDAAMAMRNPPAPRPVLAPVAALVPTDQFRPSPGVVAFARDYGVDPDDPEDPYLLPVRQEIADATVRYGMTATGVQVFYGQPWSASEARVWDNPDITRPDKELLIAATRADRTRNDAARRNSSGRTGLALVTLSRR